MKQQADEMVHNEMSSKLVKQVDEMTTQWIGLLKLWRIYKMAS